MRGGDQESVMSVYEFISIGMKKITEAQHNMNWNAVFFLGGQILKTN